MRKYSFILQASFFVFFYSTKAQQVLFTSYTVRDGLVANPVRKIFQDKKGFLWIGTWEGLSRYDGYRFTSISIGNGLSHNLVNDFYETTEGLLVAENNGSMDIISGDKTRLFAKFPFAINEFFTTKKGKLLITTDNDGIYEYSGNRFIKPQQNNPTLTFNSLATLNDSMFIAHNVDFKILS